MSLDGRLAAVSTIVDAAASILQTAVVRSLRQYVACEWGVGIPASRRASNGSTAHVDV